MRTPPPDVDEARTLAAPVLIAASVQPVLSGTVVEDESNHEILDAIDHAHQQLIAAEIAELVGILRLDTVIPAEAGEDAAALKGAIAAQIEQALAQDAFSLFAVAQGQKAGLSLDQAAIDAVHAGMR